MNFRPFKTIKKYQQLVASLNAVIELTKRRVEQEESLNKLHTEQIVFLKDLTHRQAETIRDLRKPTPMPFPNVEAVEGLVSAFYDTEPVSMARATLEVTRDYPPVGNDDVKATKLCLMKLSRHYALRRLEQAAKQDVL
jgi:hypothetical protein